MRSMEEKKKESGKRGKVIMSTANFRENADFTSDREPERNTGSYSPTIFIVSILSPSANSFLHRFYVLATSKVIKTGFEPLNCYQIYFIFPWYSG